MATVTLGKTWIDNEKVNYSDINGNFTTIYNDYNGNITDANIAAGAAISASKLATTVTTTTGTQTLTNKTLTKPTFNGSVQGVTSDTDGATVTFDMTASNVHVVTLGGNRTLAVSNVVTGQFFSIELIQDGTGSRTVTWFATIKWDNSTAPTLTTTAGKKDTFVFRCTGTNTYDGYIVAQNIG